ncbi:MAG TPA: hypothetical protein DD670_00385 [Planctomycetaceae bacterium]|nr:hypothetical protein [Planctomycetaceae bacterium]
MGHSANGPPSGCEVFREETPAKIEQGLEEARIHRDLVEEHGDRAPSYYGTRRFITRLRHGTASQSFDPLALHALNKRHTAGRAARGII